MKQLSYPGVMGRGVAAIQLSYPGVRGRGWL